MSAGSNAPVEEAQLLSEEAIVAPAQNSEAEDEIVVEEYIDDTTIQTNIVMDTDMEISEDAMAQMNIESSADMTGRDTDDTSSDVDIIGVDKPVHHAKAVSSKALPFFVDTVGDPKLASIAKAKGKQPHQRHPSPGSLRQ